MLRRELTPQRKKAIKRVLMKRRHGAVRPSAETVRLVSERDGGRCAVCAREVSGARGFHWSVHHRRPAGAGGDPRPETHAAGNLVLLHGHGTAGCHGAVESDRACSEELGLLIPKESIHAPSSVPIQHAVHGRCWLADDGTVAYEEPA